MVGAIKMVACFFSPCSKNMARRFLRRVQSPGISPHYVFEETFYAVLEAELWSLPDKLQC